MALSIEPFAYEEGRAPKGYVCGACGMYGVKLWRLIPDDGQPRPELCCADCVVIEQKCFHTPSEAGDRPLTEDEKAKWPSAPTAVFFGNRSPAIPTPDGRAFVLWDYALPLVRRWWTSLPTYPLPAASNDDGPKYNVVMELAGRDGAHASAVWGTYAWRWQARLALTWFRIFDAMPGCTFRLEGTKRRQ